MLRIVATHQGPSPYDGKLLSRYEPDRPGTDPNGEAMFSTIEATDDPAQALHFDTPYDAIELYRKVALPRPGARLNEGFNRPLTAFTVLIEVLR